MSSIALDSHLLRDIKDKAQQMINSGVSGEMYVYPVYHGDNSSMCDEEIQCLSDPVAAGSTEPGLPYMQLKYLAGLNVT